MDPPASVGEAEVLMAAGPVESSSERQPRLFLDVTAWLPGGSDRTGDAARIDRELTLRLLGSADPRAIPVAFHGGDLFALPDGVALDALRAGSRHASPELRWRDATAAAPAAAQPAAPDGLRARLSGTLGRQLRWAARSALSRLPHDVRVDAALALVHARAAARTAIRRRQAADAAPEPGAESQARASTLSQLRVVVHPEPGDVLFTAGMWSGLVPMRALAELRRRAGFHVACLCDGLAGLLRPDVDPTGRQAAAGSAEMLAMLDASDLVWCSSAWAAGELRAFAAGNGRAAPAIGLLPGGLGASPASAADAAPLPAPLAGRRFALAVDSVEARANQRLLLRCWQRLVESEPGFPLDLVLVGCAGPRGADAAAEITTSPLLNQRLFWIEACPEPALEGLHAAAELFLHPALLDEHALCLARARAGGLPIIASGAGAVPEAAGGEAQLLDPADDEAWIAAIRAGAQRPHRHPPAPPPRWDDTAAGVQAALRRLVEGAASEVA